MRRVLILGGGFGGVATAHALRQRLPEADEIVLALEGQGIQVVQGTITAIDPAARAVEVDGRRMEGDAMVVALGAELDPDAVPGFRDHAINVYDPQEIPRAAEAVRAFAGGRVVIGIFGAPYKCPPAPYEMAFLLRDLFEARGVQASLTVFTPQPMSLPVLGEAGCSVLEGRLAERGIAFLPNHRATAVEAGAVRFGGQRLPFDLLLGIPPHRCPEVVVRSGLTDGGAWVKVDPRTMETRFPGVYAIGDIVEIPLPNGMPLPKAGVFAEAEGTVVAERIAARFAGREPEAAFAGEGFCYLELGRGEAMLVRGRFFAEPAPAIELTEPSPRYVEEKRALEAERLRAWFGEPVRPA